MARHVSGEERSGDLSGKGQRIEIPFETHESQATKMRFAFSA